ncbi:MAG: hypothetical protein MZV63_64170 [Marinilabiliales bacterium]|nr:hypothetical protein [Marinilabiliales bacterium]
MIYCRGSPGKPLRLRRGSSPWHRGQAAGRRRPSVLALLMPVYSRMMADAMAVSLIG